MPRLVSTGGLDTWQRKDGATTFCGRVPAYGRRWRVLFGTDADGWTAAKARRELRRIADEIKAGTWVPPGMHSPPPHPTVGLGAGLRACVYVIQPVGGGPVKIGVSVDPQRRLADLQCGSPVRLEIRVVFEDDHPRGTESFLHQRFRAARLWGEWFDAEHPDVAAWLAAWEEEA